MCYWNILTGTGHRTEGPSCVGKCPTETQYQWTATPLALARDTFIGPERAPRGWAKSLGLSPNPEELDLD